MLLRRMSLALLLLTLLWVGLQSRAPLFLIVREFLPLGVLIIAGLAGALHWRQRKRYQHWIDRVLVLGLLLTATIPLIQTARFNMKRQSILKTDPQLLRKLGQHFIVGYTDYEKIRTLVSHGAIGGIFITKRNIAGKNFATVQQEIQSLQQIQRSNGLTPLHVATDQEGGEVSRLSPLLTSLPPLSQLVEEKQLDVLERQVMEYARIQAQELSLLGITLNFSPVVDLKLRPTKKFIDTHTQIWRRAIAKDPKRVEQIAALYCQTLLKENVFPTLKHFPGLARVTTDTHFHEGNLDFPIATLQQADWLPFRNILKNTSAFMMLGHVRLSELDADYPVSISKKVIQKIIRRDWGHEGILITDDFAMGAIYGRPGSVGTASVQALNAGVDLLLFAYDGELYYEAMDALLKAHREKRLAQGFLAQSKKRLQTWKPKVIKEKIEAQAVGF